jgi:ABC-type phosphate transport system substrate-binding protein
VQFVPCDGNQLSDALRNRQHDVGIVRDSLAPNAAKELDSDFDAFALGRLVVCVAVNAKNSTHFMTLGDLRNVFSARAAIGEEVGNGASPSRFEVYVTSGFTAESDIFQRTVMRGAPWAGELIDSSTIASHQRDSGDGVMGAVIKDPHAVGFFLLADAKTLDKRIRVLGIARDEHSKPVLPTPATVNDGTYPLTDRLTLFVRHDARPEVREFCNFALGPEGAGIVRDCGYWPDYEMKPLEEKTRLAAVKAHRAVVIAASGDPAWQRMMKDLATEFSKAKTAVEIQYKPAGQSAAIVEFVGNQSTTQPSPGLTKRANY